MSNARKKQLVDQIMKDLDALSKDLERVGMKEIEVIAIVVSRVRGKPKKLRPRTIDVTITPSS